MAAEALPLADLLDEGDPALTSLQTADDGATENSAGFGSTADGETAAAFQAAGTSSVIVEGIAVADLNPEELRSEEHTSELQSLMRLSSAAFGLKKKKLTQTTIHQHT